MTCLLPLPPKFFGQKLLGSSLEVEWGYQGSQKSAQTLSTVVAMKEPPDTWLSLFLTLVFPSLFHGSDIKAEEEEDD